MPEVRYYTVSQERELKVWANSPIEAAEIADSAFNDKIQEGSAEAAHIRSPVRERTIEVREDY
jgi:hypothetical protein